MTGKNHAQDRLFGNEFSINCRGKLVSFDQPRVMGILNISPDSFHDGGKFIEPKKMLRQTGKMLRDGADFIDLGAVSSRPGARPVSERTETGRLLPALKALVKAYPDALFSIDTNRSAVAARAIDEGAAMINDISAGRADKDMFKLVGRMRVPYILMHMQGQPETMQRSPRYKDVVREVYAFLQGRLERLTRAGITDVLIDPGFGFGKSVNHNFSLLSNLSFFSTLQRPLVVGLSRKSMINKVIGSTPATALNGTTVLHTLALSQGARLLRVHDVAEARQAIDLVNALQMNGARQQPD